VRAESGRAGGGLDRSEGSASGAHPDRRPMIVVRRLAAVIALTLGIYVALEIGLRLGAFVWYGYDQYYLFYGWQAGRGRVDVSPWSTRAGDHYKFPAHYVVRGAAGQGAETASINSLGFRGPDFQPTKPAGVFRIICLGESSTFGFHNTDTGTYPFLLQQLLEGGGRGIRVEAINAGFPYYNTGSILSLLESELLAYQPDVVTVYTAFNDAGWPLHPGVLTRAILWFQQHSFTYLMLKNHVITDRRATAALRWIQRWTPWKLDTAATERYVSEVAERYRNNIAEIVGRVRSRGADVVLIKQPMRAKRNRRLAYEEEYRFVLEKLRRKGAVSAIDFALVVHHRLNEELARIAAEQGVRIVDNIAIVNADSTRLATYVHLTEEGNLRLAEALRDVVLPLIDQKLAGDRASRQRPS
jgi:lysophospholipase L1-like esterase